MKRTILAAAAVAAAALAAVAACCWSCPDNGTASSHREAPLITPGPAGRRDRRLRVRQPGGPTR